MQRRDKDLLEGQRLDGERFRSSRSQGLQHFRGIAVDDHLELLPVPPQDARAGNLERRLVAGEADVNFLVALARSVGVERQDVAAVVDDRELIDQALELGDEMCRDKDRPPARVAVLVGTDDGLDEFAPDDRFVEDEQLRFRAEGGDQRELGPLALREVARFLPDIEPELREECPFRVGVPVRAERRGIVERLPRRHPRIERDRIGDVGDPRFDRDLVSRRIETKEPRGAAARPQQVQQAFDRRRLSRAVTAKKSIAAARLHAQVESVNGVGAAVSPGEVSYFDRGGVVIHSS